MTVWDGARLYLAIGGVLAVAWLALAFSAWHRVGVRAWGGWPASLQTWPVADRVGLSVILTILVWPVILWWAARTARALLRPSPSRPSQDPQEQLAALLADLEEVAGSLRSLAGAEARVLASKAPAQTIVRGLRGTGPLKVRIAERLVALMGAARTLHQQARGQNKEA